jgi:predicted ATPase
MITRIEINGFKTFRDFEMDFSPFTIIAGTNASGKSNLFDGLQLLSKCADLDLRTAFSEQRGDANELFTLYDDDTQESEIKFAVECLLNKSVKDNWGGNATLKYTRLRYELTVKRFKSENGYEDLIVTKENLNSIKHDEDKWIRKFVPQSFQDLWRPKVFTGKRTTPYIETEEERAIVLRQDGGGGNKKEYPISAIHQTILSGINSIDFKHAYAMREELRSWKFLQLNPQILREPTKQVPGMTDNISHEGANLAAALYRIKINDPYTLKEISRRLTTLLPNLTEVNVYDDKANKQFIIKIKNEDGKEFSSRVLSEGTLRLLTLCVFQYDEKHDGLLCFEEPENGIHPARIAELSQILCDLSVNFSDSDSRLRQVIVNTHSPILVEQVFNYDNHSQTTVWLSKLVTHVGNVNGKRQKMHMSRIMPVTNDKGQLGFGFSDEENKYTLSELKQYLKSADFEKSLKKIENE